MRAPSSLVLAMAGLSRAALQQRPVTLITFDVDGTLVQGSSAAAQVSAHARAFGHAVGKVIGGVDAYELEVPSPPVVIPPLWYHGSTDGLIALNLAKHCFDVHGPAAHDKLPSVFDQMYAFVKRLPDAEVARGIEVLPGVKAQLEILAARRRARDGDVLVGLVTGNVEGIARTKLRALGLFQTDALSPAAGDQLLANRWPGEEGTSILGGFGSDYCSGDISCLSRLHKDRGEQIVIAVRRAQASLGPELRLARVVHVGDAPSDVLAAVYCSEHAELAAAGVEVGCVAVATGKFSAAELEQLLAGRGRGWVVLERGVGDPSFIQHALQR